MVYINYGNGLVKVAHLLAFSLSGKLCHGGVQLSELLEGGADVSVKVLVFLILVIENRFVLFPFFHTADLWILSIGKKKDIQLH